MNEENNFYVKENFNMEAAGFAYCSCIACAKNCGRKKDGNDDTNRADLSRYCISYEIKEIEGEVKDEENTTI